MRLRVGRLAVAILVGALALTACAHRGAISGDGTTGRRVPSAPNSAAVTFAGTSAATAAAAVAVPSVPAAAPSAPSAASRSVSTGTGDVQAVRGDLSGVDLATSQAVQAVGAAAAASAHGDGG
jgi:hypothetical protein